MQLPPEAIAEFKALWKKEFGEELSDEKALSEARDLLTPDETGFGRKECSSIKTTIRNHPLEVECFHGNSKMA